MPEFSFDPKSIGFAVITSYPKWYSGPLRSIKHTDKIRGDLALEFFREVSKRGFVAVCSDGVSSKSFYKILQTIPNLILSRRKTTGSGESKRVAIKKVAKVDGVKVIVICEPEKVSIVTDCLDAIVKPILENKTDIVVPRREERLFRTTYPEYMYKSEGEGNRIYNETLRSNGILKENQPDLDLFFGPRAFKNDPKIIAFFMRKFVLRGQSILSGLFDPDTYSNVQFFSVVSALKKKIRVADVEVNFRYPNIQKENEDVGAREIFIAKRNMQRVSTLTDLMHFMSYLHGKKESKLRSVV